MGERDRRRRVGRDRLDDRRRRIEQREAEVPDQDDRELHDERPHGQGERHGPAAGEPSHQHERERERERSQDRMREEEHGASAEGGLGRRIDHDVEGTQEQDPAGREGGPARPAGLVHLERDEEAAEVRDLGTNERQEVRRAPQRHVDAEQTVPQVVDRRRQEHDRHAPPRQVKAASATEPGYRDGVGRRRFASRSPRLRDKDTERDHGGGGHGDVGHEMRGDPEGVPADHEVPADVPADAPAADELRGEQRPERAAPEGHPHDVMIHCASQ